jgi:hypothetical protein
MKIQAERRLSDDFDTFNREDVMATIKELKQILSRRIHDKLRNDITSYIKELEGELREHRTAT